MVFLERSLFSEDLKQVLSREKVKKINLRNVVKEKVNSPGGSFLNIQVPISPWKTFPVLQKRVLWPIAHRCHCEMLRIKIKENEVTNYKDEKIKVLEFFRINSSL